MASPLLGVADSLVEMEIGLFIFETPPQALHEHTVSPTHGPIHTNLNVVTVQESGKLLAGELALPKISGVPDRVIISRTAPRRSPPSTC